MKTSQSFSFYPADFLLGTALMSATEVGAYIRLLCFQWQEGALPKDENLLARLASCSAQDIQAILPKFREGADGKLRNRKMEEVRKSLNLYKKSRADNGKKGGRPKKPQHNHMVSECFEGAKHSESLPSPSPSPSPSPFTPNPNAPSEEAVLRFAESATIPITRECALRWLTDRETAEWTRPKGLHMLPVLPNWQADLRGYAMDWNKREAERKARLPAHQEKQVEEGGWTHTR